MDSIEYGPQACFIDRLHDHLEQEGFPPEVLSSPEDLRHHARRATAEGRSLGLESEEALAVWAVLTAEHGLSLSKLRDRTWFDLLQRDPREDPEPDWIDRVGEDIAGFLDDEEVSS